MNAGARESPEFDRRSGRQLARKRRLVKRRMQTREDRRRRVWRDISLKLAKVLIILPRTTHTPPLEDSCAPLIRGELRKKCIGSIRVKRPPSQYHMLEGGGNLRWVYNYPCVGLAFVKCRGLEAAHRTRVLREQQPPDPPLVREKHPSCRRRQCSL